MGGQWLSVPRDLQPDNPSGPNIPVPLPGTDVEAILTPVPDWDAFVQSSSLATPGSTTTRFAPVTCPDVIWPREKFGRIPAHGSLLSTTDRPRVLVFAPGCTPDTATGVDLDGVWYSGPHDVCPLFFRHRHSWQATVHIACFSDVPERYRVRGQGVVDQHLLRRQLGRTNDVARRYLATLRKAGIPPTPFRCCRSLALPPPGQPPSVSQPPIPIQPPSFSPAMARLDVPPLLRPSQAINVAFLSAPTVRYIPSIQGR
ncbi:hypothetical protein C8A00DRAFT_32487 [Chaetomidium leptoderma]|uniref:Uncharacterized protein n=1 Tax=Chaetomidium leptoderma TaxID=669021 RepID=A0AAN6ZYC4_9PEZI|nr:hypothetical protein C8A00DRAFT_32487 [Chaetomidium leptoderma]